VSFELDRVADLRGHLCMVLSDSATELKSNAILAGNKNALSNGAISHRERPASRRVPKRAPVRQPQGARQIIEERKIDSNTNRQHTSLDGIAPIELAPRADQGQN